ncbi:hypothetical protein PMPD1_1592 [Paramixta manurensis]|uniref:Uncharacterized protein n=1 Tax=Paramixta manurensis TaxID=2740817 RepID=A0A6M8U7E8_9GAMM|nr:hypothetical protein PMPD1_1592 [Erwiniaceae bacterium PD-1]
MIADEEESDLAYRAGFSTVGLQLLLAPMALQNFITALKLFTVFNSLNAVMLL